MDEKKKEDELEFVGQSKIQENGFHFSNGFPLVGGSLHLCVNLYEACLCEKTIGAVFQETLVPEHLL